MYVLLFVSIVFYVGVDVFMSSFRKDSEVLVMMIMLIFNVVIIMIGVRVLGRMCLIMIVEFCILSIRVDVTNSRF